MAKKEKVPTLDKIYSAAMEEFSSYGYEGARIDRIAAGAGINKAMIYYHFKGKEALYQDILGRVFDKLFTQISKLIVDDEDPELIIEKLVSGYSRIVGELPEEFFRIMLREMAAGGKYFKKIAVPRLLLPMMGKFEELFARGKREGRLSDVNPLYTLFHIAGANVFFNLIRITLSGEQIHDMIFKDDYTRNYSENLLSILRSGIIRGGEQ